MAEKNSSKVVLIVIVVAILAFGGYYFFMKQGPTETTDVVVEMPATSAVQGSVTQ